MRKGDTISLLDRLEDKILVGDGCWEWAGSRNWGYGQVNIGRQPMRAHRVVYEMLVGPIPDGLHLDHLCRNRACVRSNHLEPVTQAENNRRAGAAKTHCRQGHEYTEDNTAYTTIGSRRCKECNRIRGRKRIGH